MAACTAKLVSRISGAGSPLPAGAPRRERGSQLHELGAGNCRADRFLTVAASGCCHDTVAVVRQKSAAAIDAAL